MPVRDVQLNPAGSVPEVEVIFGQAQLGNYECYRWPSAQAASSVKLAHGNNIDTVVDRFPLDATAAALLGSILGFTLLIQAPASTPGQLYSYTIFIRQDGAVCAGGVIQGAGAMTGNAMSFLEYARLV